MSDRLTLPKARKMIEEILAGAPDTCFDSPSGISGCRYFEERTGEPVCLVGHLLAKLGIDYGELNAHESNRRAIDRMDWLTRNLMTDATVGFLRNMQRIQDNGYSWGHILQELRESEAWGNE
jgi:hypothetical protein